MTRRLILFYIFILVLTIFQRIAIPIGTFQIGVVFFFVFFLLFLFLTTHQITLDTKSLFFYCLYVFSTAISSGINWQREGFSIYSFLMLIILYLPFIFYYNQKIKLNKILRFYQALMIFISIAGTLFFLAQFLGIKYFDPLQFLNPAFVQQKFNAAAVLKYGSHIHRSNGVVFLEASHFSQFLAISIILEVLNFRRIHFLAVYGLTFITTFSGTGSLLLLFFFFVHFKNILLKLFLGFILLVLFSGLAFNIDNSAFHYLADRCREFYTPGQSGNIRFIAPWANLGCLFKDANLLTWLFGFGAGMSTALTSTDYNLYAANYSLLTKLIIEYGMIGFICFAGFILSSLRNKTNLSIYLLFMYIFLSGATLDPQIVYFLYLLAVFIPRKNERNLNHVEELPHPGLSPSS